MSRLMLRLIIDRTNHSPIQYVVNPIVVTAQLMRPAAPVAAHSETNAPMAATDAALKIAFRLQTPNAAEIANQLARPIASIPLIHTHTGSRRPEDPEYRTVGD